MKEYQSLSHTKWDCKYHVVFIPKMRRKGIFGVLRKHLGEMFHELARHKDCQIQPYSATLCGKINAFYQEHLNPYLNFHRHCIFAEEEADVKGK